MTSESTKTETSTDYARYESRMEHEDMLISQRVSWLVSSQAFLLSPYVLLRSYPESPVIAYVIVAIGLVSALLTYISVAAGIHAMLRLKIAYDQYMRNREPMQSFKPSVDLSSRDTRHGLIAPRGLIYSFLIAWSTLLIVTLKSHHTIIRLTWTATALWGVALGTIVSLGAYAIDRYAIHRILAEAS